MAMATRTPSPSSDSEGNASCVTLTTYYDCDNVDSEVESHFLRALQRAEGRSESGDEWQEEGASPTPSSDHCSTGMEDHSQARSSPPPSDSSRQLSAAEDTRSTVPSPTTAVTTAHPEPAATSSYRTDSSQVFLYPPPPYSHHRTTQATYPSMMVLPSHLLRAKMLQPHILQELMQPDVYAMDEDDLPNVPGQGKTGDILWPTHFVKGEPSRGGAYNTSKCIDSITWRGGRVSAVVLCVLSSSATHQHAYYPIQVTAFPTSPHSLPLYRWKHLQQSTLQSDWPASHDVIQRHSSLPTSPLH